MATKTYSKEQVSVIVGGTIVKNFTSIKVTQAEDKWTLKEGSHGEVTRSKKSATIGSVMITLPQSNSNNGDFSAYCDADALVEVEVKDNFGESLHMMPQGTFIKKPDATYEDEATDYEWTISGGIPLNHLGGNN